MTGGLLQLVAIGQEDIYLTHKPQITHFKSVYRRHTPFSKEQVPQYFTGQNINFSKKVSGIVSNLGDLLGQTIVALTLPKINNFPDGFSQFAWVESIGFSIIKKVEFIIGGQIIDKQYGDWMHVWSMLCGYYSDNYHNGFSNMIGNIPELYQFTDKKDEFTLYIPLYFWYCRNSGSYIPLICLQYSELTINIEFNDPEKCFKISPSHYINTYDDICNFEKNEYLEQNIDGNIIAGIFNHYDIVTKRLYYYKITKQKFMALQTNLNINNNVTAEQLANDVNNKKYNIYGKTSKTQMMPQFNVKSMIYTLNKIGNAIGIKDCYLLHDYYYLDSEERQKFAKNKHDYLIEQLFYTTSNANSTDVISSNNTVKLNVDNPCKYLVWNLQLDYLNKSGDVFNYTDSYYENGNNPITNQTILLNGSEFLTYRNSDYYSLLQKYQNFKFTTTNGINAYSFGIYPLLSQPSGTCNMSKFESVEIKFNTSKNIKDSYIFRGYAVCINILRIMYGIAGLLFQI